MTMFWLTSSLIVLWVAHRVYGAYVSIVGHEEQRLGRHEKRRLPHPGRHIGPKCFALIDLLLIGVVIWSLVDLRFFEIDPSEGFLLSTLQLCIRASILLALWMIFEGRHLQHFYQHLARGGRGESNAYGSRDRLLGRGSPIGHRIALIAAVLWAGVPLIFDLLRLIPDAWANDTSGTVAIFFLCFVLPQAVLAVLVTRAVLPVRRLAYSS